MDRKPQWNSKFVGVSGDEVIPVKRAGHLIPVARSQVQWAQAEGDNIRLHVPGDNYLVRIPLEYLAQRWAEHGFMLTHRGYLVFFPLVTDVWREPRGYNVRLGLNPGTVDVPVSRRHKQEVKQRWIREGHQRGNGASDTA